MENEKQVEAPGVSVVVIAYNEEDNIGRCVRSIRRQSYPSDRYELIVVDDGSTDNTVPKARRAWSDIRVVPNPSNSIPSNRNAGVREANFDLIAFTDADCEATERWLEGLVEAYLQSGADVVGGPNVAPSEVSDKYDALGLMLDSVISAGGSIQGKVYGEPTPVRSLATLNVLYPRRVLETVGGFDERFPTGSDAELSQRLRDAGCELLYVPTAVVVHWQRNGFADWAERMFEYGRARAWLIGRHPGQASSVYLAPVAALLLFPIYLTAIVVFSIYRALAGGRPELMGHVCLYYLATHLPYGAGEIAGVASPAKGLGRSARSRPAVAIRIPRPGPNGADRLASKLGAMVRQLEAVRRDGEIDCDIYLARFGEKETDIRLLPERREAADRVIRSMLSPSREAGLSEQVSFGGIQRTLKRVAGFARFERVVEVDALAAAGNDWSPVPKLATAMSIPFERVSDVPDLIETMRAPKLV